MLVQVRTVYAHACSVHACCTNISYIIVNNRDIWPAMKLDGNSSTAMWLLHHYGTVIMLYDMETA